MTRWPLIFLILLSVAGSYVLGVLSIQNTTSKQTVLNVGYLTAITGDLKDRQGLAISGALTLALDEINNDENILPNVTLALRWNDTKGDTVLATKAITEMICDGIATIFGPEGHCYVEAIVSQSRNIPMISYKCPENRASLIPTFARTEPPDTQVIKSVISLLRYYGWKKFSILHDELWTTVADLLKEQAMMKNMTINHKEAFIDNMAKCCELMLPCCRTGFWYQIVQNTMNHTRIYVFLGTASALVDFMASMDTANLFSKGEYMVIFVDMMVYTPREAEKYLHKPEHLDRMKICHESESFQKLARSLLVVASTPPTQTYENFTAKVREFNSKSPFSFVLPPIFHDNNFLKFVSIYAAYLYDSVKLYAWALDNLLRQEQRALTDDVIFDVASNGTKIIEAIIKKRTYTSVTGATIKIDKNGDSEGNFSVLAYKPYTHMFRDNLYCNFHMVPVAYFLADDVNSIPEYKLINGSVRLDWPSGVDRPFDEPMCGFANELCQKDDRHVASVVVAAILGLLLFCAGVLTMSIYRKWKIELEIEGLLWKIDISEIKEYSGNDIISSPSKLSLMSAQSFVSRCSNQVFTSTAKLRGAVVRIKELKFARRKDISREIMKEMRLLRELRHDNINSFIGACVEPTRVLLVTDYCAKGSLYDIIENEDIKLDDLFIASLIHDLIKGMIYIHDSSLVYHGNLKSSNCVVTSRWMLQVTDFGLHELRNCAESESIGEHQHYRNQFWKAPELLRNSHVHGSPKGDVYAFAIIMYEIVSRKGPFGQTAYEPKEIIELVRKQPLAGDDPFRPELHSLTEGELCPDYVLNCIKDCWNEDPEMRPDFPIIRNRLKKMRGGKTKNIMDQMMEMMEKYANNLEDIVTDRTRLLCEEKRKTEDLLHRMLPQSVAEKLTRGQGVEPVSYDSVTIYFSDIVGFTAMSAESTPLQVVNFLNDLYTVFDRIIRGYEVYKVETIGDAYMVVSGLPIKNNDRHAGEIASMALELLSAVKQHRIAHRPNETLKLRIGIHTGPVVAGVVGLTMPRYCLFGDTVNTASRMESNGEALKIHISPKCKEALDKLGGYITEERGIVNMKGKGEVTTYWLVGATDKAIQKKPVNVGDLPPPLFCRPRRSPKLTSDSRQPSVICMYNYGGGSRRQSAVPRIGDYESNYSLQGSSFHIQRESPRLIAKRYERPSLNGVGGLSGNSIAEHMSQYETLISNNDNNEHDDNDNDIAHVRAEIRRQKNSASTPVNIENNQQNNVDNNDVDINDDVDVDDDDDDEDDHDHDHDHDDDDDDDNNDDDDDDDDIEMIALTSEYSSLNTLDHSDSNETNCDKKRTAERSCNVANYAKKKQNGAAALRRHCSSGGSGGSSAIQKPLAMVRPHRIQLNAQQQQQQQQESSFGSASASIQEIFFDNHNGADLNLSSRQQQKQQLQQQNNKTPIYLREARSLDHMPLQLQLRKNQHRHQQQQHQQQQTLLQQQQQHQYQPQHQHDYELLNQKLFKMSRNNSRSLDTGVSLITTTTPPPTTNILLSTTTTTSTATATNNTYCISSSNEMHKSVDKRHLVDTQQQQQQQVFEESEEDNEERTNEKTSLIMQLNNGKITKAQTTITTTNTTNDNQQQQQQQIRPITLKPKNSTKTTTTTKIRTNRNRRNPIKTISLAPTPPTTTDTTTTDTTNVCNGSLSHKEDMTQLLPTTTTTLLKSRKGKRWHSLETINQCRSGSGSGNDNGSGNGNGNGSGKCFSRGNSISYATPADAAAQNYYFTKKQQRYFGEPQQQQEQQQQQQQNNNNNNNCLQTSGIAETNSSTFSSWLVNFIQGNSIPASERSLRRSNLLRNRVRDQYDTNNMPGFVDLTNAQRDRESIV